MNWVKVGRGKGVVGWTGWKIGRREVELWVIALGLWSEE